ncbi:MAG: hypothetical protein ABEI99_07365 [Halobaculum sp.]
MSVPSSDDDSTDEETRLRTDVHAALETALDRKIDDRDREPSELESEKLAFLALDHLDLDLTYSWYIAGANTEVGYDPQPTDSDFDVEPLGPTGPTVSEGFSGQRTEFGGLTAQTGEDGPPEDYVEFFQSATFFGEYDLQTVWFTDRFEFLEDFYEEFAPDEYRELYLTSAKIRSHLYDLTDALDNREENATLGDFGGGGSDALLDPSTEREIRYLVSDLHVELAATDELAQTQSTVTNGTDLIERVLSRLTQMDSVSTEQRRLVRQLSDFFFYCVWKYPALAISVETATGPNALELKTRHLQEFQDFDQIVDRRREQFADACRDADLLPSMNDVRRSNIDDEDGIIFRDE